MAVRNFYINVNIDGRKTGLAGGPQRKDGGLVIDIYMRDNGEIIKAATLEGYAKGSKLVLKMETKKGDYLTLYESER